MYIYICIYASSIYTVWLRNRLGSATFLGSETVFGSARAWWCVRIRVAALSPYLRLLVEDSKMVAEPKTLAERRRLQNQNLVTRTLFSYIYIYLFIYLFIFLFIFIYIYMIIICYYFLYHIFIHITNIYIHSYINMYQEALVAINDGGLLNPYWYFIMLYW